MLPLSSQNGVKMNVNPNHTQSTLQAILDALKPSYAGRPKKELYQAIADRLGDIAGEQWRWRYVQGVLSDNGVKPGVEFARSVDVLFAVMINKTSPLIAKAVKVEVYAQPGTLHPGAIILASSIPCANPACTVHFVPKTPGQKYCQPSCRKHAWWVRKQMKARESAS